MNKENSCLQKQIELQKEELCTFKRQVQAMQSKVSLYKGTVDDQNVEKQALLKEKDNLLKEHVQLKTFLPEFEKMERCSNKHKFIVDMKDRLGNVDFLNYLYQNTFVLFGRLEEAQKKVEGIQGVMEQRDTTIRGLELTQDDLRK